MGKKEQDFDKLLEEKIKKADISYKEETKSFDEKVKNLFGSISDNSDIRTSLLGSFDENNEEDTNEENTNEENTENAVEEPENEVKEFFAAYEKRKNEPVEEAPVLEEENLDYEKKDKKNKKRKKKGGSVIGVVAAVCVVVAGVGAGGYYVYKNMGDVIKETVANKLAKGNDKEQEIPEITQIPEVQTETEKVALKEEEQKTVEETAQKVSEPKKTEEAVQKETEEKKNEETVQKVAEEKKTEETAQKEAKEKKTEETAQKETEEKKTEEAVQKETEEKKTEETVQKEAEEKKTEETAQKEAEEKKTEETAQKEAVQKETEENTEEELVSVKKTEPTMNFVEATQNYKDIYANTTDFGVVGEACSVSLASELEEIENAQKVELPENFVVAVTERENYGDDNWSHINYLGMTGWIKDENLEVIHPQNDKAAMTEKVYVNIPLDETVEMRKENNAESDSMSEFSYGKEAVLLGSNDQWVKVQADGKVGWLPLTSVSVYMPGYYYVNTDDQDAITVRNGAGVDNEAIGSLGYGEKVKISQFKDGWGKISEDEEKWVILQFMTPCEEGEVQEQAETTDNDPNAENYVDPNNYYNNYDYNYDYNYDPNYNVDQDNTEQPSENTGDTDNGSSEVTDNDNTDWIEDVPSVEIPVPDDMGEPDILPE